MGVWGRAVRCAQPCAATCNYEPQKNSSLQIAECGREQCVMQEFTLPPPHPLTLCLSSVPPPPLLPPS